MGNKPIMSVGRFSKTVVLLFGLLVTSLGLAADVKKTALPLSGIEAYSIGQGQELLVLIGAIHGAHECNTSLVLQGLLQELRQGLLQVPSGKRIIVIPTVNRSGCPQGTRENANGVDLNRNWDTANWRQTTYPGGKGTGGWQPFSESETKDLASFLKELTQDYGREQLRILSLHSAVPELGAVQPSYSYELSVARPEPQARKFAQAFSRVSGLDYLNFWTAYEITGEFLNWCGDQGLVCADVELTDRRQDPSAIAQHLRQIKRGVQHFLLSWI